MSTYRDLDHIEQAEVHDGFANEPWQRYIRDAGLAMSHHRRELQENLRALIGWSLAVGERPQHQEWKRILNDVEDLLRSNGYATLPE